MEVTAIKKVTLTEQIMEQIASQILTGKLKPGEKLPNERDLAEMFHVTRSRIREALRALAVIGLITIRPGGGSFVCDGQIKVPKETVTWIYHQELDNFNDIYAARKLIETEVYLACFEHRNSEILEKMRDYNQEIQRVSKSGATPEEFLELISDLDIYVGEVCGNGIYSKLMQTMVLLRREASLKILRNSNSMKQAAKWRAKVLEAFETGDRKSVEKSLSEFFKNSIENLYLKDN